MIKTINQFSEENHDLEVLKRRISAIEQVTNDNTAAVQAIAELPKAEQTVAHQNLLMNADFDMSRNDFLYPYDVTNTTGTDADVSEECYGWYVSEPDTSVKTTGSMTEGSQELVLTGDVTFTAEDEGTEIVVAGVGDGQSDLITTINSYISPTQALLDDAAFLDRDDVQVRFRLLTLSDDSTDDDADADQATNTTLKTEDHTLYATTLNDPDWDKTNGNARIGSNKWLCQPFRQNVIRPSVQYISSFIYRLGEEIGGESEIDANLFFGIWDNSPGRKCFLESDPITITAETKGSPTATTPTIYFLVFRTNWGETIGSQLAVVNDAPTVYTNEQYVGLEWTQPAGIIGTKIYRKRGSSVVRLNDPYPANSYRDKGATMETGLTGFPEVDRTQSIAYMETSTVNFRKASTAAWIQAKVNIPVPKTYDAGKTTDRQWFVMGLKSAIDGGERALWLDRVSLDDKDGIFSRSAWDAEAVRNISSKPPNADIGGFGGSIDPGGTDYCPVFDAPVEVERDGLRFELPAIDLVDNEDKYRIVNLDNEAVEYEATVSPKPQVCYSLHAGGRELRASAEHPVFVDSDGHYKVLSSLAVNAKVLGRNGLLEVESNIRLLKPQHTVKISLKGRQKGYWIAGIGGHNRKADPDNPGIV